jgi:serine/threonine protein kinase
MLAGYELLENRSRPEGLFDVLQARAPGGGLVVLRLLRQSALRAVLVEELELARELTHPAAAPVLDVRSVGERILFTQPWYEGVSLRALLQSDAPWSFEEAAALLLPLLEGLGQAHQLGLLHREVSPDNVVLTATGPVLVDFGLARVQRLAGVPLIRASVAPEQGQGRPATVMSDLFQVGLLLCELLTTRLPALGSVSEVIARISQGELDSFDALGVSDPRARLVLEQALAVDPAVRFASADAFAQALRVLVPALPSLAPRLEAPLQASLWPAPLSDLHRDWPTVAALGLEPQALPTPRGFSLPVRLALAAGSALVLQSLGALWLWLMQ